MSNYLIKVHFNDKMKVLWRQQGMEKPFVFEIIYSKIKACTCLLLA